MVYGPYLVGFWGKCKMYNAFKLEYHNVMPVFLWYLPLWSVITLVLSVTKHVHFKLHKPHTAVLPKNLYSQRSKMSPCKKVRNFRISFQWCESITSDPFGFCKIISTKFQVFDIFCTGLAYLASLHFIKHYFFTWKIFIHLYWTKWNNYIFK